MIHFLCVVTTKILLDFDLTSHHGSSSVWFGLFVKDVFGLSSNEIH